MSTITSLGDVAFYYSSMTAASLTLVAPCCLLLGALLQIPLAKLCSARVKGILAFLACLPAVIAVLAIVPSVRAGLWIDVHLLQWDGPLALVFHVDALSVLFAFMGASIGAFVLLYSIGYMAHDKAATRFYITMCLFIGGFIGLVYSANLFVFYFFWELIGLCSFSLVGFWYTNAEAVAGARKVLLMTHIAGYGLLAAILILYHRAGSALWTDPNVAHSVTNGVFVLMLIALVAKSVQFPLHTWIPEAMAAPTPVSALLHAACYVKAGVYLAARMHSFGPIAWGSTLIWVGTVTMAVGVMYAMVQTDLKRMLAFSTVSQIGYMMMGLGIGTPLAITAALLHCLNHGFFKGGLFLTAGSVQHAAGTRDMNQLGGLAQRMPRTTLSWLIGAGSMAGVPLMSGFASKWMLYAAAIQAGWAVPAMIAWAASLGTVFLCAKATSAVFLGPATEATRDAHESPPSMVWGMGLLAAGSIVLGIAPQLAVNYLLNPILAAFGMGAGIQVTWFGLFADAGSFSTTGGLVLALVSLVLGGIIYAVAYTARPVAAVAAAAGGGSFGGSEIFTGGEPLGERARLTAADFSDIFAQNWKGFFRWTGVDRGYQAAWNALEGASRTLGAAASWLELNAIASIFILSLALFVFIRWIVPGTQSPGRGAALAPMPPMLMGVVCAVAAVALIVVALASAACRRRAPLMLLIAGSTVAGVMLGDPWLRLGLLELGAALTFLLVYQTARTTIAKLLYLSVVFISAASMAASELLNDPHHQAWSRAALLTGICIKLAVIPLSFWLLRLADELPSIVLGLLIAVVDIAAFGEFWIGCQAIPSALTPPWLLLAAAAGTSCIAALLMLTQRSLKRLLVLSTIEDVGFLLLGLASATQLGASGALAAAATHALAKALLFICLAAPEADGTLDGRGLASRYPLSASGFLFGMLAMLGVPPLLGYVGRWRLYEAAYQISPLLLAVFILSSVMALIAYTLALTRVWWGPPGDGAPARGTEPWLTRAAIVVLSTVLLAAGAWPNLLDFLRGGRP